MAGAEVGKQEADGDGGDTNRLEIPRRIASLIFCERDQHHLPFLPLLALAAGRIKEGCTLAL